MTTQDYTEIGKQVYNLVDNDKDKILSFISAKSNIDVNARKEDLNRWFDMYVKEKELDDLMVKGQNRKDLIDWISSEEGNNFFDNSIITKDNVDTEMNVNVNKPSQESIKSDMEEEDEELYQIQPSSKCKEKDILKKLTTSNIEDVDKDDIDVAIDAIEDSSDEDIDVTFEIVDMDGSDDIEIIDTDSDTDNSENEDENDGDQQKDNKSHRKKIHLDHTVNKIVKNIDDDELIDRSKHEKYYVAKREHLKSPDELDKLEDELDKQFVSYYDFPSVAIKMYESNEVKLNRIFEKLGYDFRCKDIAKFTKNWHADEK